jgi:hypothetical protein
MHLKTARAYRLRLAFQEIYTAPSRDWGSSSSIAGMAGPYARASSR